MTVSGLPRATLSLASRRFKQRSHVQENIQTTLPLGVPPVFNYFLASEESLFLCQFSRVCLMLEAEVSADFSKTRNIHFVKSQSRALL